VSDNNGGGFVPGSSGTDWSQQNAPQYALTGIASAGAGNTILSAAAAADMVGNVAQAVSGTNINTGFYQVISVVAGVSITFSTNGTAQSICTGVAASGVINIGGALLTIGQVVSAAQTNNVIWCKGTFTFTVAPLFAAFISNSLPTTFNGYGSTRGDTGRATWTSSTNSIDIARINSAIGLLFQNLVISSTAGTRGNGINSFNSGANAQLIRVVNCVFDGLTIGIKGNFTTDFAIQGLSVENCEVKNCVSHGIENSGTTYVFACFIHANGGAGVHNPTGGVDSSTVLHRCIIYSNGANGYGDATGGNNPPSRSLFVSQCNFSTNTGAGIQANTRFNFVSNSIFDRNTTYGIDFSGFNFNAGQWNNAFYNNTTAPRSGGSVGIFNDVTLSADPYTSVGTDFSLNSTAGGGAACKNAGFPGVMIAGGTGNASIGALDPSSSGGGTTIVPNKQYYTFLGEEA
jgi:hypothetical protein